VSAENAKHSLQKQLNAGATSLVLLSLLQQHARAMYGYEVAKTLESRCQGSLPMKPGALYPVLRSLEKQGLLSSHVEPSDAGPSRKYYQITSLGKTTLKLWQSAWQDTKLFVDTILESSDDPTNHGRKKRDVSLPQGTQAGAEPRTAKRAGRGTARR